ncbi:hypothetical protein [Mesorhizobium australafricanum]|uniref:Uncharacterized protein n=1 Tax=Mesorhizobium australafricanum TaxID=3072311 RepID=A0ABU4WTN5_9HYPH|nr:hypothetical protein [Mesorhizobium sp. VK3E]MDX8438350.1 hypothetical protein [Mesorhizobium sp. VK3E]
MTALALAPKAFKLPRFESWRLLKPLRMFDGQFYPYQPIQFMDGLLNPPIGAGQGITVDYIGQFANTTNSWSTMNWGSFTFPNDCLAILAYCGLGTGTSAVSGTTLGGSAMTAHQASPSGNAIKYGLFSLAVTAGTYAAATTLSGSNGSSSSQAIGAFALRFAASNPPTGTGGNRAAANTSLSITHNQAAGGVSVYGALGIFDAVLSTAQVIDYDVTDGNGRNFIFAHSIGLAAQTPHTETQTQSSGNAALVGGAWL